MCTTNDDISFVRRYIRVVLTLIIDVKPGPGPYRIIWARYGPGTIDGPVVVFGLSKHVVCFFQSWVFRSYLLTKNGFGWESEMVHEQGQNFTGFDDFGVVEKLRISAFQRYQNHQKRLGILTSLAPFES